MIKKKSPKDIIESTKDPHLEHAYIKFPGEEMIDVTLAGSSKEDSIIFDTKKMQLLFQDRLKKGKSIRYTDIHTHPFKTSEVGRFGSIPSYKDISNYLDDVYAKTMMVAQTDKEDGHLVGYSFLKKKHKPQGYYSSKYIQPRYFNSDSKPLPRLLASLTGDPSPVLKDIAEICDLQYRFVPAIKSKNRKNLEKITTATSMIALIASIFFISFQTTGFAISNLAQNNASFIGVILFVVGILTAYFSLRKK